MVHIKLVFASWFCTNSPVLSMQNIYDGDDITNENSREFIPWAVHIVVFAPFWFNYIIMYKWMNMTSWCFSVAPLAPGKSHDCTNASAYTPQNMHGNGDLVFNLNTSYQERTVCITNVTDTNVVTMSNDVFALHVLPHQQKECWQKILTYLFLYS